MSQNQESLSQYYKYLFPSQLICQWFAYGSQSTLKHRQFNFTLDINGQEVYERYISFSHSDELKRMLQQKIPLKIDIGAVMTVVPQKGVPNIPKEREFVLDIDIDDYDQVRTCCKDAQLCQKCWKLMRVACHILYRAMAQDFGFKHMMFVFSGRRGLHLWVCDEAARKLEEYNRKSIMNYMYLVTGNEQSNSQLAGGVLTPEVLASTKKDAHKFVNRDRVREYIYNRMHPYIRRSLQIIQKHFLEIFDQQGILTHPQRKKVVQKIIKSRDETLFQRIESRWQRIDQTNTKLMLKALNEELDIYQRFPELYRHKKNIPEKFMQNQSPLKLYSYVEEEIQLTFMYPRLDVNVSTTLNHLLKCPFSVHPKSRKLSVPFRADAIDTFNPDNVVKVEELLAEFQKMREDEPERLREKSTEQLAKYTVLNESILVLEEMVKGLAKEQQNKKKQLDM